MASFHHMRIKVKEWNSSTSALTSWWLQLMKSLQRGRRSGVWEVRCLFLSLEGRGWGTGCQGRRWLVGPWLTAPGCWAERPSGEQARLSSVSWHALMQQPGWGMTNRWKKPPHGCSVEHLSHRAQGGVVGGVQTVNMSWHQGILRKPKCRQDEA